HHLATVRFETGVKLRRSCCHTWIGLLWYAAIIHAPSCFSSTHVQFTLPSSGTSDCPGKRIPDSLRTIATSVPTNRTLSCLLNVEVLFSGPANAAAMLS